MLWLIPNSNIKFTDSEIIKIDNALLILEETFAGKLIKDSLPKSTANARHEIEIEEFSNLSGDDQTSLILTIPAFVNILQWGKDERTLEQLNPIALRLKNIAQQGTLYKPGSIITLLEFE